MGAGRGKPCSEVLAAELSLQGASGGAAVIVEAQQAIFDCGQSSRFELWVTR